MKITNNRLDGIDFVKSPNISGKLDPKYIVMHYTAGYTAKSAIDTFKNASSKVSAHVVVDLDGTITQMVPFDTVAWHAGPSVYNGHNGMNNYAIGIEIVNIGWLKKLTSGNFQDSYGNIVSVDKFEDLVEAKQPRVGPDTYYWPTYPEAQLKAVESLVIALNDTYNIKDIVSHEQIDTRGWKTDPGPAFPMKRFIKLLNKDDRNISTQYVVTSDKLNKRSGPSIESPIVGYYTKGTTLNILETSEINGNWINIDGSWVNKTFLRKI